MDSRKEQPSPSSPFGGQGCLLLKSSQFSDSVHHLGPSLVNLLFKQCFMIKTGNPVISIYTEMTPNPETMKFVANKLLYPGKSIDFADESTAGPSPLAKELFSFPFIKSV